MKKLIIAVALAASTVLFTGCGGEPKIPANTVAAAYVDLDKALWNIADVVELVIDGLPAEQRKSAETEFDAFVKEHKKDISAVDPEWACVTVEQTPGKLSPDFALVVKCDTKAKIPAAGMSLEEIAESGLKKVETLHDCPVYAYVEAGYSGPIRRYAGASGLCIAFVDGKYVICTAVHGFVKDEDKAFAGRMIALYKNGDGERSGDFGSLTELEDDTIARVQVAEAETIAGILKVEEEIKKFGKDVGDEDLVDMFMDVENVTLDVNLSDDILGCVLTVDAGSRELAKVVESAMTLVKFSSRVYTSVGVALGAKLDGKMLQVVDTETIKAIGEQARDAVEVDRSGSTAVLTVEFDTDDLAEAVIAAFFKEK